MKKIFLLLLILLLTLSLLACSSQEELKIGFVGTLTGAYSDIGVAGRNGVLLRVEEVNQAGGINGREIELVIKDDQGDKENSLAAIKELEAAGVEAIIGPSLSNNVLHVLDYINQNQILSMGATITSSKLSAQDDYFFRVSQENVAESILQAEFLIEEGEKKLLAVLDTSNQAYTLPWFQSFKERYTALGGEVLKELEYSGTGQVNHSRLAEEIIAEQEAALLTVSSAADTAMLAQQLNIRGHKPFFITSGWAQTEELIRQGGSSVEGIYTSHVVDPNNPSQKFQEFKASYQARFGDEPSFSANYNYDAASVLFTAIKEATRIDADHIKAELLKMESFEGIQGEFSFDQYGDVERDYMIFEVLEGEFVRFEE